MSLFGGATFGSLAFGEATGESCADPGLLLDYNEIFAEVAQFLGYTTAPTDAIKIAEVDRLIDSGLRKFYQPAPIEKGAPPHKWSFLHPTRELSLLGGFYAYELPCDFGGGLDRVVLLTGSNPDPISIINLDQLLTIQAQGVAAGTPTYAAIRPKKSTAATPQAYEILFSPVPLVDFVVQLQYDVVLEKISTANPYPAGVGQHSETILAACLSVAELRKDRERGIQGEEFLELLSRSIQLDLASSITSERTAYTIDATIPTTLGADYTYLISEIGHALGFGHNPVAYSHDETERVRFALDRGLRQFYYPPKLKDQDGSWSWSFLRPTKILTTAIGQGDYDLPSDVRAVVGTMTYDVRSNFPALELVSEGTIRMRRHTDSGAAEGRPLAMAVRPKGGDGSADQLWEILFHPIPDAVYNLSYRADIRPDRITSANPFPLSDVEDAETLVASCLAGVEDDLNGPKYARFLSLLEVSVERDKQRSMPETSERNEYGIISSPSALLDTDYTYLISEIGHALGFSHNSLVYSHDETEQIRFVLDKGLRQFYYPPKLQRQVTPWSWSFLRPIKTLATIVDQGDYDLPADVGAIIGTMTYGARTAFPALKLVGEGMIRTRRQASFVQEKGRPRMMAIRPKGGDGVAAQVWEVLLEPIPNAVYTLSYRADVRPDRITSSKPFPLSGVEDAETLLASCLAVVEDDVRGAKYERFLGLLEGSIERDKQRSMPEYFGKLRDDSDNDSLFSDPRLNSSVFLNGVQIIT